MRRLVFSLLCVALPIAGSACGGKSLKQGGPLVQSTDEGTLCLPVRPGRRFTVGLDVLKNRSAKAVVTKNARLVNSEGLSLDRAFLNPLVRHSTVGAWTEYPPTELDADAAFNWARRTDLEGARVPGTQSYGAVYVLSLDAGRSAGRVDSVEIEYQVEGSGARYKYRSVTAVRVKKKC